MPIVTFSAGEVASSADVNQNFALCVLTDTARTITVTHTWSATQNFQAITSTGVTLGGASASTGWFVAANTKGLLVANSSGSNKVAMQLDTSNVWQIGDGLPVVLTAGITATTGTFSGALTYGGVTLSNAVTGTGNMVLSASPTLTGTVTTQSVNVTNGAITITVSDAAAFAVGRQGATNPALAVDTVTNASSVTGVKIVAGASGGGVTMQVTSSGLNESVSIKALGTGSVILGAATNNKVGFFGGNGTTQPTISGSRGANAALADLLTALASMGLLVDSTS